MKLSDIPVELGGGRHDFSNLSVQGRFIRFANLDGSPSFGGRTGLSEVRFFGEIPDPFPLEIFMPAILQGAKNKKN
jgi:hypothetical protein